MPFHPPCFLSLSSSALFIFSVIQVVTPCLHLICSACYSSASPGSAPPPAGCSCLSRYTYPHPPRFALARRCDRHVLARGGPYREGVVRKAGRDVRIQAVLPAVALAGLVFVCFSRLHQYFNRDRLAFQLFNFRPEIVGFLNGSLSVR